MGGWRLTRHTNTHGQIFSLQSRVRTSFPYLPWDPQRLLHMLLRGCVPIWDAAKDAWSQSEASLSTACSQTSPGVAVGGGEYPDSNPFGDEQFAAAVEMYLNAYALNDNANFQKNTMVGSTHFTSMSYWDWVNDAVLGTFSFIASSVTKTNELAAGDIPTMKRKIDSFANTIISTLEGGGLSRKY